MNGKAIGRVAAGALAPVMAVAMPAGCAGEQPDFSRSAGFAGSPAGPAD
ncbi:hypothetical protein [Microbispora sp. KK1-11]|nr:hypothetical protein [Microbispora sp. KK1-11]